MLAKYWKKICILILIIACIFNIMTKLIKAKSLEQDLKETVELNQKLESENKEESSSDTKNNNAE
jgi:sortase (surface protein transpeptidase)